MSQNVISKFFNSFLGQFTVNAAALAGISSYAMQTFVSINEIGKDLKKLAYGEAASDYSDATGGILSSLDGYITKNTGFNPGLEGMLGDLTNQITGFFNKAPALAADNTTNTGPEKTTDPIQDAIKNIVSPSEKTKSPEAALKENVRTNSKNTKIFGDMLAALELIMESVSTQFIQREMVNYLELIFEIQDDSATCFKITDYYRYLDNLLIKSL
jgi:hypothetical protein